MDVPVFVSKKDLELIHVKKLAHCFQKHQLSDEDARQLEKDMEALNRLKTRGLISNYETLRCEKRIYKKYQALVLQYGHQARELDCEQK